MNRKRALLLMALLGCFVAGFLAGAGIVFFNKFLPAARSLVTGARLSVEREAYFKYRYGSYPVAKAALLEYASLMSNASARQGFLDETTVDYDLGLTYGRLAVAAARAEQAGDAVLYMRLATQAYAKRGRQVTEIQVRQAVEQVDQYWDRTLAGIGQ